MIVGHVPHEVSIICEVTGHRRLGKTACATIWEGSASLCVRA